MADKKTAFPMIPVNHWWGLRRKFKQSIPGTLTPSYVAAALNMQEKSARANVLPALVQMGIIDEEFNTLDRARQWRDDAQYAGVCAEILKDVYPQELLDAVPDPVEDRDAAGRWFANHTGAGEVAVRKMVTVYGLLVEADPENEKETKPKRGDSSRSKKKTKKKKAVTKKKQSTLPEKPEVEPPRTHGRNSDDTAPGVHINLQIHVSSDATPDQIDKIFESMAKHIYRKD